jgi:hypothetical protein
VKLLHLPGVTITPGDTHWKGSLSDAGGMDDLRLMVTEDLLIWRIFSVDFIDFPTPKFTFSVIHTMVVLHSLGPELDSAAGNQIRLVEAGLLLLLWTPDTFDGLNIADTFVPLTEPLQMGREHDAKSIVLIILAFHYLLVDREDFNRHVLDNLILISDWFADLKIGKVCLYLLLRICQIPEAEKCFGMVDARYGTKGAAVLEVAMKIGSHLGTKRVWKVVGMILRLRIGKTKEIRPILWDAIFSVCGIEKQIIQTIHWAVAVAQNQGLVSAVLRNEAVLKVVFEKDPGFRECGELIEWVKEQGLGSIKADETPPAVEFELKEVGVEVRWIVTDKYLFDSCGRKLPDRYVRDEQ